tara:strand:- start:356 stop:625 length:270 start_codon:yes stop_codon:yes gene_type:complete
MKITKIYDGRTVGEMDEGRKFFIRAEFSENGQKYIGWKNQGLHRFTREVVINGFKKWYLVPRKSRLEKDMLNLIYENENKIKAGGCVKF